MVRRARRSLVRNRIKELRTGAGWTQEDLARRAGVSRQTIISIEGGRYDPSLPLAMKLASLLGESVERIFFPEEE
jgi:putative transcriptional regulator